MHGAYDQIGLVPTDLRLSIFEAQNWRCGYCGVRMLASEPYQCWLHFSRQEGIAYRKRWRLNPKLKRRVATVEHIVRKADGGSNEPDNLIGACGWCNSAREEYDAMTWFENILWLKGRGEHPHFP